jgi:hypothetical protein
MSDVGVRERNDLAEKMSLAMSRRTTEKEWFQPGGRSGRNQFVIARMNATHTQPRRYKRNQRY